MLSDRTIRKLIARDLVRIDPMPEDSAFQPASIDLRLGNSFIELWHRRCERTPFESQAGTTWPGATVHIAPGECVLAATLETVTIPRDVVARVEGKSSWGRRFLMVHSTAGFIDPGFTGQITLELKNLSHQPIAIDCGALVAQISFDWLDCPADRPYGHPELNSHYQGQMGATAPR